MTPEQRSARMSRIRGKDTSIELVVRKWLFMQGFRFRKNDRRYPGTPDIVLPKYHVVIFVNGCFWHRHEGCKIATTPKSRTAFWQEKFERNVRNDINHKKALEDIGWRVITVWECELSKALFERRMQCLCNEIRQSSEEIQHIEKA